MSGFKGYKIFPEGLRKSFKWMMDNYGQNVSTDFKIKLTEIEYVSPSATCADSSIDWDRVKYLKAHLFQIYKSVKKTKRLTILKTVTISSQEKVLKFFHTQKLYFDV